MKAPVIISISFMLFLSHHGLAQLAFGGEDKGFMIGFNLGKNAPLAGYGSTSQSHLPLGGISKSDTNSLSGYAGTQSSFHYDIYAGYRIFPHLGLMVACNEDFNRFDIQTVNSQYRSLLSTEQVNAMSGDNFNITQFLAGPYLCFPLSVSGSNADDGKSHSFHLNPVRTNTSLEIRVLVGLTTANYPAIYYSGISETTLYSFGEGRGFGYFGSAGIKYEIVDGIAIHLDVNYEGSSVTYPNYSVLNYYNPNTMPPYTYTPNTYNTPKTMTIGLFQATLGFSLEL
ncbi:MAG: hypothetical protein HKL88_02210 [Bacteroidia bacterium]|nr:hypothetical protein [Bacteroidia bacterium]